MYGLRNGVAPSPSVDAMFTMRPACSRARCGRHARIMRAVPVRLTASVVSHARSKSSPPIATGMLTPASLTRMSTGPSCVDDLVDDLRRSRRRR